MAIPTYDLLIEPLLRNLAEYAEPVAVSQAAKAVGERLKLSASDLSLLLPNNTQSVFRNRIAWAHDRLKRAGLSTCPKRGMWLLTPKGRALAASTVRLAAEEIQKLAYVAPGAPKLGSQKESTEIPSVPTPTSSPTERIEEALVELRDSTTRDLLELIQQKTPEFFEHLVLKVLHAMGYGESRADLQHLGGSGDEGIDGTITLDKLGLNRVHVQAKKWKGDVGSPEIQAFMGALKLQDADKGVIFTPGDFSKPAREIAKKAQGKIVLIDGTKLTELMIEHGVGVTHDPIRLPRVDHDFFEDE
jgi:restriction system protein